MKILRVALAPLLVLVGGVVTVWANPGDAVAVRGILAWPAILANEPFLVVRTACYETVVNANYWAPAPLGSPIE